MKGPAATRVELVGIRAFGMGCMEPPCAGAWAVDPVTVLSANILLPSALQPESAAAPGNDADQRSCPQRLTRNAITHQSTRTQVLNGPKTRAVR